MSNLRMSECRHLRMSECPKCRKMSPLACPPHIFNLPVLFASTALAPISFMPEWLGWIASINPLTFAIEPIRMAYHNSVDLKSVVINAPYGDLNGYSCLAILFILTVGLFFLIRPLLNRKLA